MKCNAPKTVLLFTCNIFDRFIGSEATLQFPDSRHNRWYIVHKNSLTLVRNKSILDYLVHTIPFHNISFKHIDKYEDVRQN